MLKQLNDSNKSEDTKEVQPENLSQEESTNKPEQPEGQTTDLNSDSNNKPTHLLPIQGIKRYIT